MVTALISLTIPVDLLAKLDHERRWVPRSKAIKMILEYVSQGEGQISRLVGANLPEDHSH